MKIGSKAITELDEYHAMVKIHWQSLYQKKEGNREEIGFDVHYFVQVMNGAVKNICLRYRRRATIAARKRPGTLYNRIS